MSLFFRESEFMSLGAELELQIVDAASLALSSSSLEVLKRLKHYPKVKAELYQCMLEITTAVRFDAHEVADDLRKSISLANSACDELGLSLLSAGTHPWSCYSENKLFPAARYDYLLEKHPWIANRLLIYGMHVHIGMRDGDQAIAITNALMNYLPLLLALSSSSPFSKGADTGLNSSRVTVFEASPIAGTPCSIRNWQEFESMYSQLIRTNAIHSAKDLWWDIRPSPEFGTIEIRICDSPATIKELTALTALIHLLCAHADRLMQDGSKMQPHPDWLLRENKWRATKDGVRAEFITDVDGATLPAQALLRNILNDVTDLTRQYGYQEQMRTLELICGMGSSSDRQRAVMSLSTNRLYDVASNLRDELLLDQPIWKMSLMPNLKRREEECA